MTLPSVTMLEPANQDLLGLAWLTQVGLAIDARVILEIGTYNGLTTLVLTRNLARATVHTLDLPIEQTPTLPLFYADRQHLGVRRRLFVGTPESARIVERYGDSATHDFADLRGRCDLVYVDGAHSRDYVANDTRIARAVLSEKGAIVWDDYWRRVPDVVNYLDSHRDANTYRISGTRLVIWLTPVASTLFFKRQSPTKSVAPA